MDVGRTHLHAEAPIMYFFCQEKQQRERALIGHFSGFLADFAGV